MSNISRHVIGMFIGIVATPIVAFCLAWEQPTGWVERLEWDLPASWLPGMAALLLFGLALGALAGSRVSPLAALVPGAVLIALGAAAFATEVLPDPSAYVPFRSGPFSWPAVAPLFILIGGVLFASALFPSRWRATAGPAHGDSDTAWMPPEPAERYSDAQGTRRTDPGTGADEAQRSGASPRNRPTGAPLAPGGDTEPGTLPRRVPKNPQR